MATGALPKSTLNSENAVISIKQGATYKYKPLQITARPPLRCIKNKQDEEKPLPVKITAAQLANKSAAVTTSRVENEVHKQKPAVLSKGLKVDKVTVTESPVPMETSEIDNLTAAFSSQLLDIHSVDAEDKFNPHLVSCYVNDIYHYMLQLEGTYCVRRNYLEKRVITGRMRNVLVDWIVQVTNRFELLPETLYLSVKLLDRYLQDNEVSKDKLQLAGVTALFLACKYEEMYSPAIQDFAYITDKAYTTAEIRRMEIVMLKALDYALGCPLTIHFLRRNSKVGNVSPTTHTLAKYFCELCLVEYSLVHHRPSQIAAAALYLSLMLLKHSLWTNVLEHHSTYTEQDLQPMVKKLAALVFSINTSKLQAVKKKYAASKFMRISEMKELQGDVMKQFAES